MLRSNDIRSGLFTAGLLLATPLITTSMLFAQDGEGDKAAEQQSPISEALDNAGWIGYIIILISIISFALVIENFMSLKRDKLAPPDVIDELEALFEEENYQDAMDVCESDPVYLTQIVGAGLQKLEFSFETIQASLREMQEEETVKLFQKIGWLSLIAASAPMMGLLGTVSGMFVTFGDIANAGGSVSPAQLAGGIKLALVTTILGLIVALPTGAFFFLFRNKVIRTTIEVNAIAENLFEKFRNRKPA